MFPIKFKVVAESKLVGYERLNAGYWQSQEVGADHWRQAMFGGKSYKRYAFTGLKDKNGKEIYESDIVTYLSVSDTGVIVYDTAGQKEYVGAYKLKHEQRLRYGSETQFSELYMKHYNDDGILDAYEVLGNIYENPKLLEGEQNELA